MGLDKSACANQSQKLLDDVQTGSYSESEGSVWKSRPLYPLASVVAYSEIKWRSTEMRRSGPAGSR
jgi:hypothetical protein